MKLYTSKVVGEWLGLTDRRVRQLRDEDVLPEKTPGLWDLKPTVIRYIAYLRKGSGTNLNDERALLTRAKREAAVMENELRRGELHTSEDIEKGIRTLCLNIRSRFMVMPAKLSAEIAVAVGGNQADIFDIMKRAVDEALDELSDYRVALAAVDGEDDDGDGREEDLDR